MSRLYHAFIYYVTLLGFGVVGTGLYVFCLLCVWLPRSTRSERFFQRVIHRLFAALLAWTRFARVCAVDYRGFEAARRGGLVLAANHPGLMDAIFLIARVPEAVCIFKGAIRRNPALGAARSAGYLANDGGLGLVRDAAEKVAAGATLVVFPEGTRTPPGKELGALKGGFAAIARRAGAPIQLARITCDSNLLVKGRAWWKLPRLPARVTIELGPCLDSRAAPSTAALVAQAEAWFRAAPASEPAAPHARLEFAPAPHTVTAS
jgi:1-acyl-sn-glycerol-3-phosphate acyltransferase